MWIYEDLSELMWIYEDLSELIGCDEFRIFDWD